MLVDHGKGEQYEWTGNFQKSDGNYKKKLNGMLPIKHKKIEMKNCFHRLISRLNSKKKITELGDRLYINIVWTVYLR